MDHKIGFSVGFNILPQTWHRVVNQAAEPSLKMKKGLTLKGAQVAEGLWEGGR